MDLSQYLDMFISETKEYLQTLNERILVLEAEPDNRAYIFGIGNNNNRQILLLDIQKILIEE